MLWLVFVVGAVLSWGTYGVALHKGQVALWNPLRALLCVGIAYFLIAVLVPVGALVVKVWHLPVELMSAILKARELVRADPARYFMPDQFSNQYNQLAHYDGTAEEIIDATPYLLETHRRFVGEVAAASELPLAYS